VNLWLATVVVLATVTLAVAAMLLARRHAPPGSRFADSDRAAGVFGVLGTSFAVLLAFVIFLAFESYGTAKEKAGQEAIAITEAHRRAGLFPPPERDALRGTLICYARAVIDDEWRTMRDGRQSALVEAWLDDLDATASALTVTGAKRSVAFGGLLDTLSTRREGRRGRLAEAQPFVPAPLWIVLILSASLVLGYMCLYADPDEAWPIQAALIGTVACVVVSGLLIVQFLDRPYQDRSGSIRPVEMTRTLRLMEGTPGAARLRAPCDAAGRRR
jgi:hypothetical protein